MRALSFALQYVECDLTGQGRRGIGHQWHRTGRFEYEVRSGEKCQSITEDQLTVTFARSALSEHQIEFAVLEFPMQIFAQGDGEFEIYPGVTAPELGEYQGQVVKNQVLGGSESEPATDSRLLEVPLCSLVPVEDLAREPDHDAASAVSSTE